MLQGLTLYIAMGAFQGQLFKQKARLPNLMLGKVLVSKMRMLDIILDLQLHAV